ncbi:efflux RND transporter periplasmic adaptor subunit [Luteitalea sp.]
MSIIPARDRLTGRRLGGVAVVIGLVALAGWAVRPRAVEVVTVSVTSAPLQVTLDEDGETRVQDRYVVSAPVAGRVLRIDIDPGDRVEAGTTVVATMRPAASGLLDARTRAEQRARVAAAQAALGAASSEQARVRESLAQAERVRARTGQLVAAGAVSRERMEAAEVEAATQRRGLETAAARVRLAEADLRLAQATLITPPGGEDGATLSVRAPIEAVVPQGEPLIEIADLTHLEVVADFLSTDAVRIRPGQAVVVDRWGGSVPLAGHVRRVEPAGFTKVSALGVEEQRVNVVIALDATPGRHVPSASLPGDRFRVEVRVVVWEATAVTQVPVGSLVRDGDDWCVYVVTAGRAVRTPITIGQRNDARVQVLSGLTPGAAVIAFPGSAIGDGVRVRVAP